MRVTEYAKNQAKWKDAEEFCADRMIEFKDHNRRRTRYQVMDRGFEIKDMLVGNETPDEIMDLIRDTFESVLVPEVGGYYTFVYSPTDSQHTVRSISFSRSHRTLLLGIQGHQLSLGRL